MNNSAILPGMLNPMAPRKDIPLSDSAGECYIDIEFFQHSLLFVFFDMDSHTYTQGIVDSPS
jgi:hypothetical protein